MNWTLLIVDDEYWIRYKLMHQYDWMALGIGSILEASNGEEAVEVLQRESKVNIAGPSTMAALLNSLQMGFKTLAIQKRSSEVWSILGAVKNEFEKFGDILAVTQQRMDQANRELDKLVGVRTRSILRKLKDVEKLEDAQSIRLLGDAIDESGDTSI